MVLLVALAQAPQDFDGVIDGGLTDVDGLEAPFQRSIPLDVLAVLIQGCGTDALQLTPGEGRLENVGRIDGALSGTGTDQGVDLVDHQDHVPGGLDLFHDLLEALLKLTAVFGPRDEQTNVKGEDALVFQDVWNFTLLDALSKTFGDGRLAHTRLADQHRIVLGAATQDLDDPFNFVVATNHRIQLGLAGHLGEVAAEFIQGWRLGGTFCSTTTATAGHFGGFTQHANDLGSDLGQIHTQILEHTGRNAFTFTDQAEQQMLGTDVVVPQLSGFFQGELEHPLSPWREGDLNGHKARTSADDLLHFNPGVLEVDTH